MFGRIIVGLVGTGIGFAFVKYAHQIYMTFGAMDFAEKYLRFFGGTRLMIKFIGLFIIFMSFLYMTGLTESFLTAILSPFAVN